MTISSQTSPPPFLYAGLLDLPVGSTITLDGQSIVLQRNDFVGFVLTTTETKEDAANDFHLLTVRAGAIQKNTATTNTSSMDERRAAAMTAASTSTAVTVAFVLPSPNETDTPRSQNNNNSMPFVCKFDVQTEEVSVNSIDATTVANLQLAVSHNQIEPQRVIPIHTTRHGSFQLSSSSSNNNDALHNQRWYDLTKYVSSHNNWLLSNLYGIQRGAKVVAGGLDEDVLPTIKSTTATTTTAPSYTKDGMELCYAPIPIFGVATTTKSTHHHQQQRQHKVHLGTRRFLAQQSPSQRTRFGQSSTPNYDALMYLLQHSYQHQWQCILGDLQFSYIMFYQVHCLASLEHWRDLITLLSMVEYPALQRLLIQDTTTPLLSNHDPSCILELYCRLLHVLTHQLQAVDSDLMAEVNELSTNDQDDQEAFFLTASLQQLVTTLTRLSPHAKLEAAVKTFVQNLQTRFPMEISSHLLRVSSPLSHNRLSVELDDRDGNEDEYDEDGPVVVAMEDVEASLARSAGMSTTTPRSQSSRLLSSDFSILKAAMQPHEDVLMTCARALDEANDVSLVREAAAYLEQVEANARLNDSHKEE